MFLLAIVNVFIFLIIFLIIFAVIFYYILCEKYKEFILLHSKSIKELKLLNIKYQFKKVELMSFKSEYDNENYYDNLSTFDQLVYDLIKHKKEVKENISFTIYNSNLYDFYINDIKQIKKLGEYDLKENKKFKRLLLTLEEKLFNELIQEPTVDYIIDVKIVLTNINKEPLLVRYASFGIEEIEDILYKIEDKTNQRYNNKQIWDSICRVERAKVTNRIRFFIYERDGYRCCKCGKSGIFNDLEIDHIMPISKGGKTHPDNLQTLCKRCNKEKSNIIEPGTKIYGSKDTKYCPCCGAPLRLVNGKNGKFYGCMNYPNCKYTKNI